MRQKSTKYKSRRISPWLIIAGVLLLVGTGSYGVVRWNENRNSQPTKLQDEKEAQDVKERTAERIETPDGNAAGPANPDPKGNEPAGNEPATQIGVVINRASQLEAGGAVNVRTTVTGTSSGDCVMRFTKAGHPTVSRDFQVAMNATYATCDKSDIPASAFPESGEWQLAVTVASNGAAATSQTVKVTITK